MHTDHDSDQGHAHHPAHGSYAHEPNHGHAHHEGSHDHHEHGGEHHGNGQHHPHPFKVDIKVNGTTVVMLEERPTGLQIKEAALKQGAPIQLIFVLQVEHHDGTSSIVGDTDHVHLHEGQRFTAIAPDDNS